MQNLNLAKIYVGLDETKNKIENVILPLMSHIGFPDQELADKLRELTAAIDNHYSSYEIQAKEITK